MSDPYLGEIRMFAGNYAPQGWAFCNGQLLNISDYQALYSLLGTTYGGDGVNQFALPDLQGRIPIHPSQTHILGEKGGTETVQLTQNQLPPHSHVPFVSTAQGSVNSPNGTIWAQQNAPTYSNGSGLTPVAMNPQLVLSSGGNQPHDNMMPSLTVSFIISLNGTYPQQN